MTQRSKIVRTAVIALAAVLLASGAGADPDRWKAEGWTRTDFSKTAVDLTGILPGGPPRDGIPPIDDPKFVRTGAVDDLDPQEPVISVVLGGMARAYPLRVLIWHEIVNDTLAGRPIVVTYCPLCNSAIVFDRRIGGRVLDFGTTGKLRNSDLVMYDRQTETWWQQFTGQAIVGALTGTELEPIAARIEAFSLFAERHPDGEVLVPADPEARPYGRNPYAGYDTRAAPYALFRGDLPTDYEPMGRVIVFESGGKRHAVTLAAVIERGSIEIGDVTVAWRKDQRSALDAANMAESRDVGNVTVQRRTADGPVDVVHDITFGFVVHAFHPDLEVIDR